MSSLLNELAGLIRCSKSRKPHAAPVDRFIVEPLESRCLLAGDGGAALVADIYVGPNDSNIERLIDVQGTLFFNAWDGTDSGLWKNDELGTVQVAPDVYLQDAVAVGDRVVFSEGNTLSLWTSDGTAQGTYQIAAGYPTSLTVVNDKVFFKRSDVLFVTDAVGSSVTELGVFDTVRDMASLGDTLLFAGNGQLWRSDGTTSGTYEVANIYEDHYCVRLDNPYGGPPYRYCADVTADPRELTELNGVAYFTAQTKNEGRELWRTDGTTEGTYLLKDVNATPLEGGKGKNKNGPTDGSHLSSLTTRGDRLYFWADDGIHGTGLWTSDGTAAGTVRVADVQGPSQHPDDLLYFRQYDQEHGSELWRSDGTAGGTFLVADVNPGPADGFRHFTGIDSSIVTINTTAYFVADDGEHGLELWQTDGTEAGTFMVEDIYLGIEGSIPNYLTASRNKLFFVADDGVHGRELWDPPAVESSETLEASAPDFKLGDIVQISGESPFNGVTSDLPQRYGEFTADSETIPLVAVDPSDPNHMVVAWTQDEWTSGAARGVVVAVTFDGGESWQNVVVPGLGRAAGGDLDRPTDPRIAIGPDGSVYVTVIVGVRHASFVSDDEILIAKSPDGGLSWNEPVSIISSPQPGQFNHHPFVTPHPTDPDIVYFTWNHEPGARPETRFTRSTDGGLTWEEDVRIHQRSSHDAEGVDQLFIHPDGTLINVYTEVVPRFVEPQLAYPSVLSVLTSDDDGVTWSEPIHGPAFLSPPVNDPETGQGLWTLTRHGYSAEFAMDQYGNLYAVWEDGSFSGGSHAGVAFSMSTDKGQTWSQPIRINKTPDDVPAGNRQAYLPSIAVADDGTVGVAYYDFRNNTPDAGLLTDYWFTYVNPGDNPTNPESWREIRLTDASFDVELSPQREGILMPGIYQATATAGNDFIPVWVQPHDDGNGGVDPASVFTRRIMALGAPSAMGTSTLATTSSALVAAASWSETEDDQHTTLTMTATTTSSTSLITSPTRNESTSTLVEQGDDETQDAVYSSEADSTLESTDRDYRLTQASCLGETLVDLAVEDDEMLWSL